jgi:hypothetical protein
MVPGGRKELVKKPALPFGKSFPFRVVSRGISFPFYRPLVSGWMVFSRFCFYIVIAGVQSPLVVFD